MKRGPRDPRGVPGEPQERFPGYDVLAEVPHWDTGTAQVVLRRLGPAAGLAFFTAEEEGVARALLDRLLANDSDRRVPVFELVDQRLAEGSTDGWHHDSMPPDGEAWRRSCAELGRQGFAALAAPDQRALLEGVRQAESFAGMPAAKVWDLWLRYACAAYYAHPWAWSEIGFGGPAYPRGYKNIGVGKREPWEVQEAGAEDPIPWVRRVEAARQRHR